MKKNILLTLNQSHILGQGMERTCYLHPENRNQVIKIPNINPTKTNTHNVSELKTYTYISKRFPNLQQISKCYGFVITNHGYGLVCDCIRDFDGTISKTLYDISSQFQCDYDVKKIRSSVVSFCDLIVSNNIQLFDLNIKNIVIKKETTLLYKAVSIDLKGRYANKEFIPVSTYIPYFSKRKLKRRSERLLARLKEMK